MNIDKTVPNNLEQDDENLSQPTNEKWRRADQSGDGQKNYSQFHLRAQKKTNNNLSQKKKTAFVFLITANND